MTYAVLRNNGDLLWFDAIRKVNEKYTGKVSSHPLESGNVISDHTTLNNIGITLSGVISAADFNTERPVVVSNGSLAGQSINQHSIKNDSPILSTTPAVTISPATAGISAYLPDSVSQYITPNTPVVTVAAAFAAFSVTDVKGSLIAMQRGAETFTLVEFDGGVVKKVFTNCIVTSLSFDETPESGYAIYPEMTIEQVRFATTKVVQITRKGSKNGTPKTKAADTSDLKEPPIVGATAGSQLSSYATQTSADTIKGSH
jgi:hypothetical protein